MPTISIRIDEELKKKMEELSHVSYSTTKVGSFQRLE
jgi:predicted transcriptional regulator